jgi:type IV secretory pathway VirB2 component (pilin)
MKRLILLTILIFTAISGTAFAYDPIPTDICSNATDATVCKELSAPATDNPVSQKLEIVINILSIAAGVIAVIYITVTGITMATAQGNPESISKKRNAIIYTSVGVALIASARVIVLYVAGIVSNR